MPEINAESTVDGVPGVFGLAHAPHAAGVQGVNDDQGPNAGPGVLGKSRATGIVGESETWMGAYGHTTSSTGGAGVMGEASAGGGDGVYGVAHAPYAAGVEGVNDDQGPNAGPGVLGKSRATGVWGESKTWMGVFGVTESTTGGHGVLGKATGPGAGVAGQSTTGVGVLASTDSGEAAFKAEHKGGGVAGSFTGKVGISGQLNVNGHVFTMGDFQCVGADVAEEFDVVGEVAEPGSVVVLAGQDQVCVSTRPYDRLVAGVVSGAGDLRPGLLLGRSALPGRQPLALTGRVWVKAEAHCEPIRVGDMLTTSSTPGHAMKATNHAAAFGSVLGKALADLPNGCGLIPILVALQ